jgi:hypothetical protein
MPPNKNVSPYAVPMNKPAFQISRVSGQAVSDMELLPDLRRVACLLGTAGVSMSQYRQHGLFEESTVSRRFGSWNKALVAAGLSLCNEVDISDERLFENILLIWQHYGRQPRRGELARSPSTISQSPYNRRFRGWTAALKAFVDYANSTELERPALKEAATLPGHRTAGREPSLRLRWKVLHRDRFTCCGCGRSPATTIGIELHVDHVIPWSKGGETVFENLQTLCSGCNIGKSNEHEGLFLCADNPA